MAFPQTRMRRLRSSAAWRALASETTVDPTRLVQPLFIAEQGSAREPIASMPGIDRLSVEETVNEAKELFELGLRAVLLFGVPAQKDAAGSSAYASDGVVQQAVHQLKQELPDLLVWTDVCLCAYTDHGHCGVLSPSGEIRNDETVELLAKTALSHAQAGADAVAPSDMMDGRVAAIRAALDQSGFEQTVIVSYAAKFASAFYGPFRDAAGSSPQSGDRRTHQLDPANADEAVRDAELDLAEGADILMVKPALAYLDIVSRLKQATNVPIAAYSVSGEYAMTKAASAAGALDERSTVLESLLSMHRAGAQMIVTYYAKEVAKWLQ